MSGASPGGTASLVGVTRDKVGESPVWSTAEQALWWVDIEGRLIRRFDSETGKVSTWSTPERVGCIALHRGGGLIAAMESGVFRVSFDDRADGTIDRPPSSASASAVQGNEGRPRFTLVAEASHRAAGMRFNDGRCDASGRLWVGSMVMDMSAASDAGALYRLAPEGDGLDSPVVQQLLVPNGLAFSPDGRVMYLSDSHPEVQVVWRFEFDVDTGTARERQLFVDMRLHPGRPDGAAVDEDGCYWSCANDAGMIHRFTPDGRLDRSAAVPVSKPSMCAFGGAALDTLFVTSIRPAQPGPAHPDDASLGGGLFMLDVKTRGLAEPMFG